MLRVESKAQIARLLIVFFPKEDKVENNQTLKVSLYIKNDATLNFKKANVEFFFI